MNKLFGKSEDLKTIYARGAVIVDVRTPEEFRQGHIKGAVNIPLNLLPLQIPELKKKNAPVITCCKSGGRSGMARATLAREGFEVYNGGPWESLENRIH